MPVAAVLCCLFLCHWCTFLKLYCVTNYSIAEKAGFFNRQKKEQDPSFLNIAGKAYLLILILLFAIDRRSFSLSLISKTSNNTQIILTLVDHRINRYNLFWLIHFVKNYILLCDEDQVPLTTQD